MYRSSCALAIFSALALCGPVWAKDISSQELNLLVERCEEEITGRFSRERVDVYGNLSRSYIFIFDFLSYRDSWEGEALGYGANGFASFSVGVFYEDYKGNDLFKREHEMYIAHCVGVGSTSKILNIEYKYR